MTTNRKKTRTTASGASDAPSARSRPAAVVRNGRAGLQQRMNNVVNKNVNNVSGNNASEVSDASSSSEPHPRAHNSENSVHCRDFHRACSVGNSIPAEDSVQECDQSANDQYDVPISEPAQENSNISSEPSANSSPEEGANVLPTSASKTRDKVVQSVFKLVQININGVSTAASRHKLDQIFKLHPDVDLVAIQESKLKPHILFDVENYIVIRKDRESEDGGGGLLFLIRKDLKYSSVQSSNTNDTEVLSLCIHLPDKVLTIVNSYHPRQDSAFDIDAIQMHIKDNNTILLGDLNAKHHIWGSSCTNQRGTQLSNFVDDHNMIILNDGSPTHISYSYNTSEVLDITAITPDLHEHAEWSVLPDIGSDHKPILISVSRQSQAKSKRPKYWNFKKANWSKYEEELNRNLQNFPDSEDIETVNSFFATATIKAAKQSIPRGNYRDWKPNQSADSPELKDMISERKRLRDILDTSPQQNIRQMYNRLCAKIKLEYTKLREKRWIELCSSLNPKTGDGKIWKLLQSIDRKMEPGLQSQSNMFKDSEGNLITDNNDVANKFSEHYVNISKLEMTPEIDRKTSKTARTIINQAKCHPTDNQAFKDPITEQELTNALLLLDPTKAPGPDKIFGHMLLNMGSLARACLLKVINLSWKVGRLPKIWKFATVTPILKPCKPANELSSYRPISLTSLICKTMERTILTRLEYYLISNQKYPTYQGAYRKKYSTTDQLLYFTQNVHDMFQQKPGKSTIAAFIDLSQAFDRVWKQKLITVLHDLGIEGKMIIWINAFLQQRKIQVKFNGGYSKPHRLLQGTPQGSILSPILFSLYLSTIHMHLPPGVKIALYADDIIIWTSHTDRYIAEKLLNQAVSQLQSYTHEFKISLNPNKSEVCLFTLNNSIRNWNPSITFSGTTLPVTKSPKYLGVTLDPSLSFSDHIDKVVNRAKKRLNILKAISGKDWGANAAVLAITYKTLVRPLLEYAIPTWCSASPTQLEKLDKVQSSAARIICGLRNTCPSEVAEFEANLLPLKYRRTIILENFILKRTNTTEYHRTGSYINRWSQTNRLKKQSPLSVASDLNIIHKPVAPTHSLPIIPPHQCHKNIQCQMDLEEIFVKKETPIIRMKMLGENMVHSIPADSAIIYTDGSTLNTGKSGSGVHLILPGRVINSSCQNSNGTSNYKAELIAIEKALNIYNSEKCSSKSIYILSDSKSAIQSVSKCFSSTDDTLQKIAREIEKIPPHVTLNLNWLPSHVGIIGNEIADQMAKEGTEKHDVQSNHRLTADEFKSISLKKAKVDWKRSMIHEWYSETAPGNTLELGLPRAEQTALSRLKSGHLKPMEYQNGSKIFPACIKCLTQSASPEHILSCLQLCKDSLYNMPKKVITKLRESHLLDFA
jgi:ribonuclease HI